MSPLIVALLLASNASGKTVVRSQHGTLVPAASPVRPLVPEDSDAVAHLWFRNAGTATDTRLAWSENGTVPIVTRSSPAPAGRGVFSDANYFSLGSGNDALDFAGNFTLVFVYRCASLVGDAIALQNGTANSGTSRAGYLVELCRGGGTVGPLIKFMSGSSSSDAGGASTNAQESTSTVNVACVGRNGSNGGIKVNGNSYVSAAAGTITAGTSSVAKIGRYEAAGNSSTTLTLFELYATRTGVSDALCTLLANEVKAKLGLGW